MITHLAEPEDLHRRFTEIAGTPYHHLFRVRRLPVGTRIRMVDGRGNAIWVRVVEVTRNRAVVEYSEKAPVNEPDYRLELVVAAPRSERASWLVEKATELGVSAVRFVRSVRTARRYGRANLERLRRVAAAALVQCHRSRLPEISGVDPWERVAELLAGDGDRFSLAPRGDGRLRPRSQAGVVLVGPEGGWTSVEAADLESLGCAAVDLGPRVLRVETAALVAAARLLL